MVELVDTPDLGSGAAMRVGSSPIRRTTREEKSHIAFLLIFFAYNIRVTIRYTPTFSVFFGDEIYFFLL